MITNSELSPEQVKIYRKIFFRYLKDNDIYSVVKKHLLNKNISFESYLTRTKGERNVTGVIDTIWQLVRNAVQGPMDFPSVIASIVMLSLVTDNDFLNIFKPHQKGEIKKSIDSVVINEFSYLFRTLSHVWSAPRLPKEYKIKVKEIVTTYCDGKYATTYIYEQLKIS